MTDFKKGECIVLLAGCNGKDTWYDSIPINYCYVLREDSSVSTFQIEKDINGSTTNGWFTTGYNYDLDKLDLRLATPEEYYEYCRLGKPFDVTTLKNIPDDLTSLTELLDRLNIR